MNGAVVLVLCLGVAATRADPQASEQDLERLTKIAFGSCAKQISRGEPIAQPIWNAISDQKPDLFLWLGDAIYPKPLSNHSSLANLEKMYRLQSDRQEYQDFESSKVVIDGVWDDHDYGVNDAGKDIYSHERQDLFLDFLKVPKTSYRRERHGVYFERTFGLPRSTMSAKSGVVQIIGLDTRCCRDDYAVPSVGGWSRLPLAPLVAAVARFASAKLSIGQHHDGDMLGLDQWAWLEQTLSATHADVTLVLSSVQLLTSSPLVESWDHFPDSQRRLLNLLTKYRKTGLLVLSGDVHFSEFNGRGLDEVVEVTSSGMTHSCSSTWFGATCKPVVSTFSGHRASTDMFFTGKNFGTISIDWENKSFAVQIHDEKGQPVPHMSVIRRMDTPIDMSGYSQRGVYSRVTIYDMQESPLLYASMLAPVVLFVFLARRRQRPSSNRKCKVK